MTPAPLTCAECDLQDFAFMPLDVARLRDSELASNETPESCWAAVLLWAASWHQLPAASIPNDEKWIAKTAGYALRGKIDKAWSAVRDGALRGWVECSDGRLYHPVVAEKARDAWAAKIRQRWGCECARIKKHNDRHPGANVPKPSFEDWIAAGCPQGQPLFVPRDKTPLSPPCPAEIDSKREGEGQREGERQGQGEVLIHSVPDGTAGEPAEIAASAALVPVKAPTPKPPKTPAEEAASLLWATLKTRLVEQEASPSIKAAGELLGRLVSKYGKDVFIEAARVTVALNPIDAHTYLAALCETAAGKRQPLAAGSMSDESRARANEKSTADGERLLRKAMHGEAEVIDA